MNPNAYSEFVTALSEWRPDAPTENIIPSPFIFSATNPGDFINKPFGHSTKTEHSGVGDSGNPGNLMFPGNPTVSNIFHENIMIPPDSEHMPMDDYDPLESFTFWDGETFYCNRDFEANCGLSPNVPDESEMSELQDYLIDENPSHRDDLAHIDDADLIRSNPTLAELNSCGDSLIDRTAENSFLSEDSGYLLSPELLSKSVPINDCSNFMNPSPSLLSSSGLYFGGVNVPIGNFAEPKNNSQSLLSSSCPVTSRAMSCPQYFGVCDERLLLCPQNSPASDSLMMKHDVFSAERQLLLPGTSKSVTPNKRMRTSSSLPRSSPLEVVMRASSPKIKAESPSSSCGSRSAERTLSGFSALSLSNDDESGSYFDSDHDDDADDGFSSDEDLYQYESDETFSTSWPPAKDAKGQPRRTRFFWQYNLQSRGVKTQNLIPLSEEGDPYVLNDVKDPVFSEGCSLPVKHSGKARKGDGNDLTPNPRKLYSIGMELKKLNKLIYNLNPTHDFAVQGKPLSRKEKNKLASRVCRLKKKAQHEANKIKLCGLQQEHKRLLTILIDLKRLITYKIEHFQDTKNMQCFQKVEDYLALHEPGKIAGFTTDFVNEILDKVSKGDADGGLSKM